MMVQCNEKEFSMDGMLKSNMDIIGKKILEDWDWLLVISGSGKVRVGKSVIGLQIASYLAAMHNTKFTVKDNIVFNSEELIKVAKKLKPYSVVVYDEAREGLEARKSAEKLSRNLLDFFAECGQLNLFIIVILPDFFELKKNIAITRSIALINVYYGEGFTRGFFSFYNDEAKKMLYLKGKQYLNYMVQKPNFRGRFSNFYPVSESEYRAAKKESLGVSPKQYKTEEQIRMERDMEIIKNGIAMDLSHEKMGRLLGISGNAIGMRLLRDSHRNNLTNNNIPLNHVSVEEIQSGEGDIQKDIR